MADTTTRISFGRVNGDDDKFFEVRAGVPVVDALNEASCHLETALGVLLADTSQSLSVWAAVRLVESARALILAATPAIEFGGRAPREVVAAA